MSDYVKFVDGVIVPMSDEEIAERQATEASQPSRFVPQSVTMRQARLALLAAGLLDAVDQSIAAIPDATQRKQAQIDWEFAATVDRNSPLVNGLSGALGLTEAALDDLFVNAATL